MKRYAFIDVQNTESTARKMLGFCIDWIKLSEYLKNSRSCTEMYLYSGIDDEDLETRKEFDEVIRSGCCIVKTKTISAYKNMAKEEEFVCPQCKHVSVHKIDMGYTKKSNCDVELTFDVAEKASNEVEILLFTGDGDFEYLIREILKKGVQKVCIYSYAEKYINKNGFVVSVFSSKLRNLISENPAKVFYFSLSRIKEKIQKIILSKEGVI